MLPSTLYIMSSIHLQFWNYYVQRLRRRCTYKKIYDLDLGVKVSQNVAQCPPHYMTYAFAKFEAATSNSLGVHYLTFNLGSRSNKKLCSTLYIMWPMQFEVAMSNGLGICIYKKMHNTLIRSYKVLPSSSCDLCTYKVWSYYVQQFRRRWCIDKLGVFHANQISMCLDPHLN